MRTNAKPCALAQVVRRLRDFLLSLRRLPYPWFRTGKPILHLVRFCCGPTHRSYVMLRKQGAHFVNITPAHQGAYNSRPFTP